MDKKLMNEFLVEFAGCKNLRQKVSHLEVRNGVKVIAEDGILNITPDPTHYLVKVMLCVANRNFPIDNLEGRKEVECKVSIKEYERWLEKRKAIEWL